MQLKSGSARPACRARRRAWHIGWWDRSHPNRSAERGLERSRDGRTPHARLHPSDRAPPPAESRWQPIRQSLSAGLPRESPRKTMGNASWFVESEDFQTPDSVFRTLKIGPCARRLCRSYDRQGLVGHFPRCENQKGGGQLTRSLPVLWPVKDRSKQKWYECLPFHKFCADRSAIALWK